VDATDGHPSPAGKYVCSVLINVLNRVICESTESSVGHGAAMYSNVGGRVDRLTMKPASTFWFSA
jgi:hypothetical protein